MSKTEQPPAGKLTKELINTWNDYLSTSFAILNIPQKRELCSKVNGLIGKVCARLDRSEARRNELLALVGRISFRKLRLLADWLDDIVDEEFGHKDNIKHNKVQTDLRKWADDIEVAITKAKKEVKI